MSLTGQSLMGRYIRRVSTTYDPLETTWHGDEITGFKEQDTIRMMFHNVNGLSLQGASGLDLFVHEQASLNIDLQGLTEHCLDTTKYEVYHKAQDLVRHHSSQQSLLALHSSEEPATNIYKPGGTGFLILGELVSKLETPGIQSDLLGRWSSAHIRRRNMPPLSIIVGYQVCQRPTNILGNTAYHQQVRALSKQGRHNEHPRSAFIHDLTTYISQLQEKGHDIILGGDFNEALTDRHSGMHRLLTSQNLIDPFLYRFPQAQTFGTHINGSRRIDMILVSPGVLSAITKIGYAPYDYSKPSDHRPCLVEFNTRRLLGHIFEPISRTMKNRTVRSKDKASVEKFVNAWFDLLTEHPILEIQQSLDTDAASPAMVERLDELIGQCGQQAERKCRRRRPEFYSRPIVQQRIKVSLLRGHLRALRAGKDRTNQLTSKMNRYGLAISFSPSIRITNTMLSQEVEKLKKLSKDHLDLRQQELEEKVQEAARTGKRQVTQILAAIQRSEMHQSTYRILRNVKNKASNASKIDRLEIPNSWPLPGTPIESIHTLEDPKQCTQWRLVTSPTEMEYYLVIRNRLHFGQAEGTPFTMEPLRSQLDWSATSQTAEEILRGEYVHDHSTPNCHDLLKACRQIEGIESAPAELTAADFRGKIRNWKEATTTSPSGRHLGWYKSLYAPGRQTQVNSDVNESTSLRDKQGTIASLILSILNYCLRNTYVLNRWRKIVNVMIFKEPGNYKIHRLRVIHIYEADFNLILAVKWRHSLRNANNSGVLNPGQYGGRPGCEAQSLTLLEELKYDLAYLTRRTLFNFDNDASSCYDRIVVPLASIINRKYGIHKKVVAVHAQTLATAQYYLKTANGVSSSSYSTCEAYPIHGTGQGSGNSPSIWLFLSSTIFDVHKSLAYGAKYISPDGKHQVTMSMVGFVDDSTGILNDFQPQSESSIPELCRRMQHDAQLWNNLLFCTGGKLELTKCSFHVLSFEFRPNGAPIPSIASYDNTIHITDLQDHSHIPIPSKRVFESHRTLGHIKSPSSRLHTSLEALRQKADRIALLVSISPLTRPGALLAYHTVYLPSVKYVLPQSFYDEKALDKAQASSISMIISKCGLNRHTARTMLFAPRSHGGGGFHPWYLLQGQGQVLQFLKHWRTATVISDTLKVAVQWAQWQSGHNRFILDDTTSPLPYLECRWITSLRNFLRKIAGKILLTSEIVPPKERKHDRYIMEFATSSGLFNPKELSVLNYCRLYLHVTTISELFDSSGTKIIPDLYYCKREPWFNPNTVTTLQRRPSNYQVKTQWQRLCRQWITSQGELGLSYSLGPWEKMGHQLRRRRQTYVPTSHHGVIYHWIDNCYWAYLPAIDPKDMFYKARPTSWTPDEECIPIAVVARGDHLWVHGKKHKPRPMTSQPQPLSRTFIEYIRSLPTWERALLEGVDLLMSPFAVISQVQSKTTQDPLLAVSDGSVKSDALTYGWIFGDSAGILYARHKGQGTGQPTSHRAEAWGMLSAALFVHHLCQYTNVSSQDIAPPLHFICDNLGLITRTEQRLSYQTPYPNSTLAIDWEMIEQIVSIFHKIPIGTIDVRWIKGHQDDNETELTVAARYNIMADHLADMAHSQYTQCYSTEIHLPSGQCYLYLDDTAVTSHYGQKIHEAFSLPAYKEYLCQRYSWDGPIAEYIDWNLFRRAISKTHQMNTIQRLKFLHDKLPTNYELSKSHRFQSNKCHYCLEPETFQHLLQCPNPISTDFRHQIVEAAVEYMTQKDFPCDFCQDFLWSLTRALAITQDVEDPSPPPCSTEQLTLGLRAFMKGFLHSAWRMRLIAYARKYALDSTNDQLDGLAGLVALLWQQQLQFWSRHNSHVNNNHNDRTATVSSRTEHYKARIRDLYSCRDTCLPGHRDAYFPVDLEDYLASATISQLKQYLHHYEPAIRQSVLAAQQNPQRPLTMFPGFVRQMQQIRNTTRNLLRNLSNPASATRSDDTRGVPTHHKHTRWRNTFRSTSIKDFFTSCSTSS